MALFDRLKAGLEKTARQIRDRFLEVDDAGASTPASRSASGGRAPSSGTTLELTTFEAVEDALIAADVGLPATERIVDAVKRDRQGSLSSRVGREVRRILGEAAPVPSVTTVPHVILIVGVNGTGKTTTVGKLANLYKQSGKSVLVCAADTFRAAAVEQLAVWTERAGVDLVRAQMGSDPAAVTFDAVVAAKSRQREIVIIDTAGRLHTKTNLMAELDKIRRIISREVPGAPHEVLLVLDATVGQNGLAQAREFQQASGANGIVLTKLDGTAKGGVAVAIAHDLRLPIRFVGVGEGIDDFLTFDADAYVDAIFSA